jgi:uncharacterized membrane protein
MAYGPLEYYIIGFQGHKFSGEIAPALVQAAKSGAIRIRDVAFVTKDKSGAVSRFEYQEFDNDAARAFAGLDQNAEGMFTGEDLDDIGNAIDNDSSAALVLVEHLWAAKIREAIVNARGQLLQNGILTEDAVHELEHTTT